jgi:hypothetical protein
MLMVSTSVFSAVMRRNTAVSRALKWLGFTCHFLAASCDEREEMDGARSDQLALLRSAVHDLAAITTCVLLIPSQPASRSHSYSHIA